MRLNLRRCYIVPENNLYVSTLLMRIIFNFERLSKDKIVVDFHYLAVKVREFLVKFEYCTKAILKCNLRKANGTANN